MFNVRLAGDHLYGKWLFTWLLLAMSLMMSNFRLSVFHKMSWMRSGTEWSQFLRIVLPTLKYMYSLSCNRNGCIIFYVCQYTCCIAIVNMKIKIIVLKQYGIRHYQEQKY